MRRLARRLEKGAIKYDDRDWEKGRPLSGYMNSALGHLYDYLEGDDSEDHLAAAMFQVMGLIHTEEMIRRGKLPKKLNDMPNYIKGK